MSNKDLKYKLSLQDLFSGKMAKAVSETERLDAKVSGLGSKLQSIGIGIGVTALGKSIIDTTAQFQGFEMAIKAGSSTAEEGTKNIAFLNAEVDRLGLDITAAFKGFKTFQGALKGTNMEGNVGRKIFSQVSEAVTAMGLTGDDAEGIFLAMGQMISKGSVQAEELKGQLGERLPGAFQKAANAMGVTTAALGEMMKSGEVTAEDLLPKLADALGGEFADAAKNAQNGLRANLNKMETAWIRLKTRLGNELTPVIISTTQSLTKMLNVFPKFFPIIKILVTLIGAYILKVKLGAISSYQFAVAQRAMAMGMSKSSIAATFLSRGIRGIGAAIKSVPIIGWIAALIEGIQYLWDTFSGFREAVYGFVESIKQMGDTLVLTFRGIWNVMKGTISGDAKMMKEGMIQIAQAGALQLTAANRGIQKGKDSFAASQGIGAGMEQFGTSDKLGGKAGAGGKSPSGASGGVGGRAEISSAKPQNIIINVDKLVNDLSVNTTNMTESAGKVKEMISKALLEALNDANNMAKA